jgi:hypothetical protein
VHNTVWHVVCACSAGMCTTSSTVAVAAAVQWCDRSWIDATGPICMCRVEGFQFTFQKRRYTLAAHSTKGALQSRLQECKAWLRCTAAGAELCTNIAKACQMRITRTHQSSQEPLTLVTLVRCRSRNGEALLGKLPTQPLRPC